MLPIGIARTMILAIATSLESEPGKSKWLPNNDQAESFSWMIKQIIRNKTMKKQYKHGYLLISCPKHEIYVNKQAFQGTKTRRF